MLTTKSSDLHHKTFLIKQDDKFFSRLLSREFSMSRNNNKIGSFRGLPSSVPFIWESQPGTPKHRFHSTDGYTDPLPPLTPPPSFFSTAAAAAGNGLKRGKIKRQSSLNALFHKLTSIKKSSSLSSSLSSSSSSTLSSFSGMSASRRRRFGSWGGYSSSSSSSSKLDEENGNFNNGSPTSTLLCFMIRSKQNKNIDLQKRVI